jgi:ADP-heptose:LPS heptosyltransferase
VTLDNGILHLASAGEAPVVGLFRHGIHWLWCPHRPGLQAVVAEPGGAVGDIPVSRVLGAAGVPSCSGPPWP